MKTIGDDIFTFKIGDYDFKKLKNVACKAIDIWKCLWES